MWHMYPCGDRQCHCGIGSLSLLSGLGLKFPRLSEPASTKTPLSRVGLWGFRYISKEYEDVCENNKTETIDEYREDIPINTEIVPD